MKKILLMLSAFLLTMSMSVKADNVAQAIWCAGNKTLYFTYQEAVTTSSTFDGQAVTAVWSGDAVTNSGSSSIPDWTWENMNDITKVKFINTFVNVEPTSLCQWFWGCKNLATIEGIEYLNTSEVTTMNDMFHSCIKLTSIDLTHFDISKLGDCGNMFWGCSGLKTIYCNKSWTLTGDNTNSDAMFWACDGLTTGDGKEYDRDKSDITMACPFTGYFTPTPALSGTGTEAAPFQIATADHWNMLAEYVAAGRNADGLYFQQTGNFEITKMMGTADSHFSGTYDGNSHILTANIDGGTGDFCAPFDCIENATIKNVFVRGEVKGGIHSAGLVARVSANGGSANTCLIENCNVTATITCSSTHAGGIIGHGNSATLTVRGCAFNGKITRDNDGGTYAGAIIGWCNDNSNFEVSDCFEGGTYEHFTNTGMNYKNGNVAFGGTNCYNTHSWTDGSIKAMEVTDDTDGLIIPTSGTTFRPYETSLIVVCDNCMMVQVIEEIEENGSIDADIKIYAQADQTFSFTSSESVTAENTSTEAVIDFSSTNPYTLTMPADAGITLSSTTKAYAIWCAGNSTLYFDKSATNIAAGDTYVAAGDTYDSQTVTAVWSGNQVTNTGWSTPGWEGTSPNVKDNATRVVFTEAFKDVKPKSLYLWFCNFKNLSTIEGIANLNTSECTVMNSTFYDCDELVTINVNGFDVSKVSNATSMFRYCNKLTTIYCNNTWSIQTANLMFDDCKNLVGASSYSYRYTDGNYANPTTGYFTTTATPHAIWCEDNTTLYFAAPESDLSEGGTWDGQTITKVWTGEKVTNDSGLPDWINVAPINSSVQHVVFDSSFGSVKPKYLYGWFSVCTKLEDITGLQYLNTSEATTMDQLFYDCKKLTVLDLTTFDFGKVTDLQLMFSGCTALTKIICNNTLRLSTTENAEHGMFDGCTNLQGAIDYNSSKVTSDYANPITGYFTTTDGALDGSSGTEQHPIKLLKPAHWEALANFVAKGRTDDTYYYFKLEDHINIGSTMVGTSDHPFYGCFDGDGKALVVDIETEEDYAAPFRYVGKSGSQTVIKDLVTLGTIKTSKQFVGGIISKASNSVKLLGCQSFVEINSSKDGDGTHGGLVAFCTTDGTYDIEGCVFSGKLLGSSTNAVGGLVGWRENSATLSVSYSLFVPEEVSVGTGNNSRTLVRYNSGDPTITKSYYVETLGDAQGTKAYEIDNDDEYLTLEGKDQNHDYTGSRMYFSTDNNTYCGMMVQVLDELEDDNELDGDFRIFAEGHAFVRLSTVVSVTFKDEDGNEITGDVKGEGTTDNPYTFNMPFKNVETEESGFTAYAIWCESNKTLYFDASINPISLKDYYNGKAISAFWKGGEVVSVGWGTPEWNRNSIASNATKVVFTSNFAGEKPKSLYKWFCDFIKLETIEGIENLNTSECTNFNSAFYNCNSLTKIDVDGFDVSKVTNSSAMFYSCDNLKTIFCNNTWSTISTSTNMFAYSRQLSGAVSHSDASVTADMANPNNGYFTKKELTLANAADNSDEIEKFEGIKNVKVTLDRTLIRDGNWNTLCLPFDVTISGSALDKSGVEVKELDVDGTYDGKKTSFASDGTLYLYFKDVTETLKAGKPYIIKWTAATNDDIENPEFTGVTISSNTAETVKSEDTKVSFKGTYVPVYLVKDDKESLFLGDSDRLYYPDANVTLNSCCAYFHVELGGAAVRRMLLNFGDDEVQGITTTDFTDSTDKAGAWFTFDGKKLDKMPTRKGLYINNGRKVVVK